MDAKRNSPLTCEQVSELISEYIDGELDDATAAAVASHIDNCDACRQLYEEISAVCRAVSEAGEVQIPDGLHERIMDSVNAQKRASRRRRTITYLGFGVAAMLCISVMSSTLIQRMGTNGNDLIILSEQKGNGVYDPTDGSINTSISYGADNEDVQDKLEDAAGGLADQLASAAPEEPEHTYATDHPDGFIETTTRGTTTIPTTTAVGSYTGAAPSETLVPETTMSAEDGNKGADATEAPAEAEPEHVATESPSFEEITPQPQATMADVKTEAVQDAPSADAVQRPSSQGKPDYSLITSAPGASFNIYNVWTWTNNGVSHTLELRSDGTFTYTHGSKITEGSFTFEDNVLTLRYGWLGKARYSVGVYKGNISLLHVSGRKLLQ